MRPASGSHLTFKGKRMYQVWANVNGGWQAVGTPHASMKVAYRWAEQFDPTDRYTCIVRRVRAA